MEYSLDEIEKCLLDLAAEGLVLPSCPNCGILLALDEIKAGVCDSCKHILDVRDITWKTTDTLPES